MQEISKCMVFFTVSVPTEQLNPAIQGTIANSIDSTHQHGHTEGRDLLQKTLANADQSRSARQLLEFPKKEVVALERKPNKSFQTLQTSHHNNIIHNFGFVYIIYTYIYIYQIYNHICIMYPKNSQLLPVFPWSKCSNMAPHFCGAGASRAAVSTDTVRKVCDSFRSLQPGSCARLAGLRVILRFGQIGIPMDFSNEAKF